jgi:outer membrane protein TolC
MPLALVLIATPAAAQSVQVLELGEREVLSQPRNDGSLALTIDEAVERGLATNFRVQRSNRNEATAEQRVNISRAQLRPRFDLGFGAGQNQTYYDFRGNAVNFNRAEPQFYADLFASASFPIDISGVVRRQVRQARLSYELSELDQAQAIIDVSSDVRANYATTLRAQEQVTADEEYLTQIDDLLTRARVSQPVVVNFLETERANALQSLESTKTSRDLAMANFRQLLRLPRDTSIVLTTEFPSPSTVASTNELLELAIRNRIDLKQASIRLQQAQLATVQAGDTRRPSFRLTAYASQRFNDEFPAIENFDGKTRSGGVVASLSFPLVQYDGGILRANRKIAALQAEQALADREEASERAENEINQVMIGLNRANQRLASLPDVKQARTSLDRVETQMLNAAPEEAAGFVAQVTNARQNLRSAVVARNDALTDFYANYFRLMRAIGTEELQTYLSLE